jgi:hypothetical protein
MSPLPPKRSETAKQNQTKKKKKKMFGEERGGAESAALLAGFSALWRTDDDNAPGTGPGGAGAGAFGGGSASSSAHSLLHAAMRIDDRVSILAAPAVNLAALHKAGFRALINVTAELPPPPGMGSDNVRIYLQLPLPHWSSFEARSKGGKGLGLGMLAGVGGDGNDDGAGGGGNGPSSVTLADVFEVIDRSSPCVIYSSSGGSRCNAVAIAYLVRTYGVCLHEAVALLRARSVFRISPAYRAVVYRWYLSIKAGRYGDGAVGGLTRAEFVGLLAEDASSEPAGSIIEKPVGKQATSSGKSRGRGRGEGSGGSGGSGGRSVDGGSMGPPYARAVGLYGEAPPTAAKPSRNPFTASTMGWLIGRGVAVTTTNANSSTARARAPDVDESENHSTRSESTAQPVTRRISDNLPRPDGVQ